MKYCKTFQDLYNTVNTSNEICKLNLTDSWDGPLNFVESLIEWIFTLIEPKFNLIKLDLYQFKEMAAFSSSRFTDFCEQPVFLLKKNKMKILKNASYEEINLILSK